MSLQQSLPYFNKYFQKAIYELQLKGVNNGSRSVDMYREQANWILDFIFINFGTYRVKVDELMCGPGFLYEQLILKNRNFSSRFVGIDFNPFCINYSRNKYVFASFFCADIFKFNFFASDLIILSYESVNSFDLQQLRRLLKLSFNILNDGGAIYFDFAIPFDITNIGESKRKLIYQNSDVQIIQLGQLCHCSDFALSSTFKIVFKDKSIISKSIRWFYHINELILLVQSYGFIDVKIEKWFQYTDFVSMNVYHFTARKKNEKLR